MGLVDFLEEKYASILYNYSLRIVTQILLYDTQVGLVSYFSENLNYSTFYVEDINIFWSWPSRISSRFYPDHSWIFHFWHPLTSLDIPGIPGHPWNPWTSLESLEILKFFLKFWHASSPSIQTNFILSFERFPFLYYLILSYLILFGVKYWLKVWIFLSHRLVLSTGKSKLDVVNIGQCPCYQRYIFEYCW